MIVYSQRVAGYLMMNGFVLQGINKSNDNSKRHVFLFKDSCEIKEKIKEFTEIKSTRS